MSSSTSKKSEMSFVDGAAESGAAAAGVPIGNISDDCVVDGVPISLMSRIQNYYNSAIEGTRRQMGLVRPWREFFDRQSFAAPSGLSDSFTRLNRNINHYYHNYIIMALIGSSYVLLLNPTFSFFVFVTLMMWWYVNVKKAEAAVTNSNHFILGGREITFSQAYLFIIIFGGVMFFLSNGSSVVFWLVLSSLGIVVAHAVMRRPAIEEQPFSFV